MDAVLNRRRNSKNGVTPRRGLEGGRYKPLTPSDIRKLHETVLRTFEEVGIQVNDRDARDLFRKAGARVDETTALVKVPGDLVSELVGLAPSTVRLCGRGERDELDCVLGGTNVYMGTGGTALNVQDPGRSDIRPAMLEDVQRMAQVVDALDNLHFYMLNVYPHDLHDDNVDVNRFAAALNRTRKHVMGGVYTIDGVRNVIRMAQYIAGSEQELRERPIVSMVTCVISPFKIDEHYARLTMEVARHGIPVVVPSEPLCGATAPITLAGNILVQTVDSLAGVMLAQLVNPGTPTIYGCVSSITDMRELKYLSGAVEMGLLNAAAAQMAQYYGLPFYATAGMTDAKVSDAQAGYESAITSLMVALAGANFIHDAAGFIEFCLTASYDKLVIDNDIIGMTMRAVEGIRVDDETLAFDEVRKAGPGGHFVSSRHTRRYMRREHYTPLLCDRENRESWKRAGETTAWERATRRVREIVETDPGCVLPEAVRSRIRESIPGLKPSLMA